MTTGSIPSPITVILFAFLSTDTESTPANLQIQHPVLSKFELQSCFRKGKKEKKIHFLKKQYNFNFKKIN